MDSTTLRSIRALLDLRIAHADDPVAKLRLAVVFNRPDKLRLETLPTNGFYTLGLLVSNGETTHLMEAGETQQVRSAKSPEALVRRLLGVSLGHADIFRIISGREAVIPADGQWGQQSVVGPLLFSSIAEHVQYAFDAVTLVLSTLQRYDRNTDQLLYKVEFEEFFEVGGKIFPKRGIIFLPRDNVTVWFETSMLKLNDRPAESLFSLPR